MANRYWVGGTGTWGTTTTNWAATSGGASGVSVPTAADDVYFDANSNTGVGSFTVTMATTPRVCRNLTVSGLDGAMTLAGANIGLTISGDLLFSGGLLTLTYTGTTTFNATTTGKTVTTNSVVFAGPIDFNGVGGGWTLGSALALSGSGFSGALNITRGTFDTSVSNYNITGITQFSSANTNTRTINLNNSNITVPGGVSPTWSMSTTTGLTFNAGGSTITFQAAAASLQGGGSTFNNVSFTSNSVFNTRSISGTNTFLNLTFTAPSGTGIPVILFLSSQTITGTLTLTGTSANSRYFVSSSVPVGTTVTLTCASIAAMTDVDFRDITIAGAHGTLSGTRLGDCNGNSNITFNAGVNKYWNLAAGGNWSATAWALSSGGAVSANNFPLAQDTVIIENTGLSSTNTVQIDADWNIGTLDISTRTTAMTFAFSTYTSTYYGNLTLGSGVTVTGGSSSGIFFSNRSIKTLNSAGKTFTMPINIYAPGGGIQLLTNNLTVSSGTQRTTTLSQGTLDLNNLTLNTQLFNSSNSSTRTIAFGTGQINCTGTGNAWLTGTTTGLTTTGTQVVNVTSTGSSSINVQPGGLSEANSISFNLTGGTYTVSGVFGVSSWSVRNLNFTGFAGTLGLTQGGIIYGNLTLSAGMTLTASTSEITFGATSGTKTITSNTKTIDIPITVNGVGGTFQLQDALTMGSTKTATLTNGTLDLQSYKLSTGLFSSSNSNTRTIAFGTGSIDCTGTGLVWATSTVTGLTTTGTQVVNVTSTGSTAISLQPGVISEANSISFNFTGGTYTLTLLNIVNYAVRNLDFTGFAGTWGVTNNGIIYGNLTLSTGMSLTAANPAIQFSATSGTKTITSNGRTMDFPITFNGVGGTWACQDALTLGSTRALTMTNGTLQLKDGVTSTVGSFVTTGTTLKYLQSTTSGVQATLSDASGVNTVTYLSIQDSNATGGATFFAYDPTNVDAGNNTGWIFVLVNTGNFLMFF